MQSMPIEGHILHRNSTDDEGFAFSQSSRDLQTINLGFVPSNRVPKIEGTFCNTINDPHKHIKAGSCYQFGTTTHAPHKIESNPGGEEELFNSQIHSDGLQNPKFSQHPQNTQQTHHIIFFV
jgi:hypothetical protein